MYRQGKYLRFRPTTVLLLLAHGQSPPGGTWILHCALLCCLQKSLQCLSLPAFYPPIKLCLCYTLLFAFPNTVRTSYPGQLSCPFPFWRRHGWIYRIGKKGIGKGGEEEAPPSCEMLQQQDMFPNIFFPSVFEYSVLFVRNNMYEAFLRIFNALFPPPRLFWSPSWHGGIVAAAVCGAVTTGGDERGKGNF